MVALLNIELIIRWIAQEETIDLRGEKFQWQCQIIGNLLADY